MAWVGGVWGSSAPKLPVSLVSRKTAKLIPSVGHVEANAASIAVYYYTLYVCPTRKFAPGAAGAFMNMVLRCDNML